MSTEHDVTRRLLAALKWYEYRAKQEVLVAVSRDHDAAVEIISLLAADAGLRGLKARALHGDDSAAEGGV